MNDRLTLNNGTELRGHARETRTGLYLYVFGKTLAEAYALLAGNTQEIHSDENGERNTFRGYTHLKAISEEIGGMVCAVLIRAEEEE